MSDRVNGSEQLEPGSRVGSYVVGEQLGEGAMGVVYRAADSQGRPVAIKLARAMLAADPRALKRFGREARAGSRIVNPHLVAVLDTGEFRGVPFIVQQLLSGGSLMDRLREEGSLPREETVRVCCEVAAGLDALHAEGLVHRDLKPGNILFDEVGAAYVTDFGLVKDRDASALTASGAAIGSVAYMAPEQVRDGNIVPATDVYALGCVAFECLAGRRIFAGRGGMQLMWAHLHEVPPHPCDIEPAIPRRLGDAVLRALAKEPEDRPARASDFAALLRSNVE